MPALALARLPLEMIPGRQDPRPLLQAFLLERYGAECCVVTASGTHALQLALQAVAAWQPGGVVLIPGYTCYEVATACIGAGVPVALYDLDPYTLEPDWDSVRAVGRGRAAALLVAPLFGLPLDFDTARTVADELGCFLIEDAAQGHGTSYRNRPVGSFGDLSILSFGRGKGWTGGGGALLGRGGVRPVHDPVHRARTGEIGHSLRMTAAVIAQWLLGRPQLYGAVAAVPYLGLGRTIYHDPTPVTGMSRASAALIAASRNAADAELLQRRHNANQYTAAFRSAGLTDGAIGIRLDAQSGALRYPLRVRNGWHAMAVARATRFGAAPGYPTTLSELRPIRASIAAEQPGIPGAELLARELVTLPTHAQVTSVDAERLIAIACRALDR